MSKTSPNAKSSINLFFTSYKFKETKYLRQDILFNTIEQLFSFRIDYIFLKDNKIHQLKCSYRIQNNQFALSQ